MERGAGGGHIIHVRTPEDHGLSYLYNTETKHVGFSPTPPVLIAPNANRREAFGESYEGRAASYYVPLVSRIWAHFSKEGEVLLCRVWSYRLVQVKKTQLYSPANARAVFSIQTVKFCPPLLCALAKTSPDGFLFFLDFSSV